MNEKQSLLDLIRANGNYRPDRSVRWFQDQIRNLYGAGNIDQEKMFRKETKYVKSRFQVGDMILFAYDAKLKKTLPYWDKFPLVLPFSMANGYMTGLNLHYLPPSLRLILLTEIEKLNHKNRALSWERLKKVSSHNLIAPCVKQYILANVKSRYIVIPESNWMTAAVLPTDNFQKQSNRTVWSGVKR